MNTRTSRGLLWTGLFLAGLAMAAPGCRGRGARAGNANAPLSRGQIVLDGLFNDWPANVATVADQDWIYFRVAVEGQPAPIQASPETLELWLDADDSDRTGQSLTAPIDAADMGIDLVVTYSPSSGGRTQPGARARALNADGAAIDLTHAQIGLTSMPTYGSAEYEVRISRHIDEAAAPALARLLSQRGRARGLFVLKNASGQIIGWSDPERFDKPAAGRNAPLANVTVPEKTTGAVRVVTFNVRDAGLMQNPGLFARLLQVVDADIFLLQEWDTDAATAAAWFTATITGEHAWHARTGPDVVIVSPYPVAPLGPDRVTHQDAPDPVRFIAGVVQTPIGEVAVGTAHLTCCGTSGSPEDLRRIAEANAINSAMRSAMGQLNTPLRIIAGDFNVVGSSTPLAALAAGLDVDASELAVVQPMVLGDRAMYTWFDPGAEFPPGRLDYILIGDAGADAAKAFVLDTRRLSTRALARMGLDPSDSAASDHLPVVVDIKPR